METKLKLLSDEPYGEIDCTKEDGLGFVSYVKVLSNAAVNTEGPFNIGVFGEWGTGKTTLMRMIQNTLKSEEKIITVWFNAWKYENEEHPIVPLIGTIVKEIEINQTKWGLSTDTWKKLKNSLRAIAYGFSAKSNVKIPGLGEVEAAFIAKEMIDRESTLSRDPLLDKSLYFEAFERLNKVSSEMTDVKIVIFIDDLDRCFPDKAIKLLESIKLILAQKNFLFFIGVAKSILEGYLQHRYQNDYGIEKFNGKTYLDKIIQMPFIIPPHAERMSNFIEEILRKTELKDKESLKKILIQLGVILNSNPRMVVRFLNNILVDKSIYDVLNIKKSLELEYFAITRALQTNWTYIFSILAANNDICAEIAKWKGAAFISQNTKAQKIINLIQEDIQLSTILTSKSGIEWLENKEKRDSSIHFINENNFSKEKNMQQVYKYDLYVSYTSSDIKYVNTIVEILRNEGYKIFYEQANVMIGKRFSEVYNNAIVNSKSILLCLSEKAFESEWVNQEMEFLKTNNSINLLPIYFSDMDYNYIPMDLKDIRMLAVNRKSITRESLLPLIEALEYQRQSI